MKFSAKIISWYTSNKRELPWRGTSDPYKIWLSEIILQQTRIDQGSSYYLKFLAHYPDIYSLAAANEQDILKLWQGLGYYTRARNLHKTAKLIVKNYNGDFPDQLNAIRSLPGIGDYTAAAILSISFNKALPVVDGNVIRVISRIFGIKEPVNSSKGKKLILERARDLIYEADPGTYNQAIMEFGALHCVPRNPLCRNCIFVDTCFAYNHNEVAKLPVKKSRSVSRKRYFNYLIFKKEGNDFTEIMIKKREGNDIWKNLFEFPLIEEKKLLTEQEIKEIGYHGINLKKSDIKIIGNDYKHILSHQVIFARFFLVSFDSKRQKRIVNAQHDRNVELINPDRIKNYPVSRLVDRFLEDSGFYKPGKKL